MDEDGFAIKNGTANDHATNDPIPSNESSGSIRITENGGKIPAGIGDFP
jgi:hypothetical protein